MKVLYIVALGVALVGCADSAETEQAVAAVQREASATAKAADLAYAPLSSETKRGIWQGQQRRYNGVAVRHRFTLAGKRAAPDTLTMSYLVDSATSAVVPVEWDKIQARQ